MVQASHWGSVEVIAFSPDGKQALTGSYDKMVLLWDVKTGRKIRHFAHEGTIKSIAYLPHNKQFISICNYKKEAFLWDTHNGQLIKKFTLDFVPYSITVFPDGKRILVQNLFKVQVWSLENFKMLKEFKSNYQNVIRVVALSPNGRKLALGYERKNLIKMLDIETGSTQSNITTGHESRILFLSYSLDGNQLVSADEGGQVKYWNLETGKLLTTYQNNEQKAKAISFLKKKRQVLILSKEKCNIIDIDKGKLLRSFKQFYTGKALAVSPDESLALIDMPKLKLMDLKTGQVIYQLPSFSHFKYSFEKKGIKLSKIFGYDRPSYFFSWDGRWKQLELLFGDRTTKIVSPDRTTFITLKYYYSAIKEIKVWDMSSGRKLHTITHKEDITSFAFSPDGKFILTTSNDKTACLWNTQTGKLHQTYHHNAQVASGRFSQRGKTLATGSSDATAKVWNIKSGKLLKTLIGHQDKVNFVRFINKGKELITGSDDQTIIHWNIKSGEVKKSFLGHINGARKGFYLPKKKILLTLGNDRVIKIWQLKTGQLLGDLYLALEEKNTWLFVTPDGKFDGNKKGFDHLHYIKNVFEVVSLPANLPNRVPGLLKKILSR